MPRGPADRPIRAASAEASAARVDEEVALQAAMRRALEQGAAPVAARSPAPDPPVFKAGVAPPAPIRGVSGVSRARGARAAVLHRRTRRKEAAPPAPAADPRGRGGKVDVRG